jgi:cytidylate kinase
VIIAIDGPAAAGKGTLARSLAKHLSFAYLDSGSLYRAVALNLIISNLDPNNEADLIKASKDIALELLDDTRLRDEATGRLASQVAANKKVRENLLHFQQNFASNPPHGKIGAVIDGRDIGSVVCPTAQVKLFVTASAEERAKRRLLELEGRGLSAEYQTILNDIEARDKQDSERQVSPLVQADDAILLDTTNLNAEKVFNTALGLIKATNLV